MTGRFAPTPSGRMHIGNVYAMLGAWLSARKSGDSIRLRIEDIDEPRVVPGAAETMMRDLEWLGLGWDGEPVFQSSRHALYQEALELLSKLSFDEISDIISTGFNDSKPCSTAAGNEAATSEATPLIYPCFCSRADIRAASAPQEGDRFTVYPGTCRRLIASEPQRAKQRLANNDRHSMRIATADTTITFHDEVFGTQQYNLAHDIGDIIVRRSDGIYSYQLAVTVDDLDMGITDIVRGRDLLRSNALQIYIRKALINAGFKPSEPTQPFHPADGSNKPDDVTISYAHLPLIDNAAGQRLAKRERSLDSRHTHGTRRHRATDHRLLRMAARIAGRPETHQTAAYERRRSAWRIQLGCRSHQHVRPHARSRRVQRIFRTVGPILQFYSAVLFCSSIPQSRSANP